ncbi:hypothetical protein EU545_03785 [Candidatus Thorarchaeota archaeon]|nr:MAG: hypothetical protein EU545_03785 [Candidatus Thorarchaeota archaeon]
MESAIDKAWKALYYNNPKFQAFAVSTGSKVVWQTSNWNLVDSIDKIKTSIKEGSNIHLDETQYTNVIHDDHRYAGTAKGSGGHLLLAQIVGDTWAIAWVEGSAVPALAIVDLEMAAIGLKGSV